jgi:hypothetical protein
MKKKKKKPVIKTLSAKKIEQNMRKANKAVLAFRLKSLWTEARESRVATLEMKERNNLQEIRLRLLKISNELLALDIINQSK